MKGFLWFLCFAATLSILSLDIKAEDVTYIGGGLHTLGPSSYIDGSVYLNPDIADPPFCALYSYGTITEYVKAYENTVVYVLDGTIGSSGGGLFASVNSDVWIFGGTVLGLSVHNFVH